MIKNTTRLIYIAVIIIAIGIIYFSFDSPTKRFEVSKGRIAKIETMAQLCALDFYSEVPILDTINDRVICAIQKQKGSISFDLENLQLEDKGDTVKIKLSPEIVDIYEATEDNSWYVVDTKAIGMLSVVRSDRLSDYEENAIKSNIAEKSKKELYRNGTVERARIEGAQNLQSLMEKVYRKPVKVIDPTPKGAHYDEYK